MTSPKDLSEQQRGSMALRARYRVSPVKGIASIGKYQSQGNSVLVSGPPRTRDISSTSRRRLYILLGVFMLLTTFLIVFNASSRSKYFLTIPQSKPIKIKSLPANDENTTRKTLPSGVTSEKDYSSSAYRPSRTVPVIDRSVLQRLNQLSKDKIPVSDSRRTVSSSLRKYSPPGFKDGQHVPLTMSDICGEDTATPCQFLLALRIVEQESKARMHLLQIIELARRLRRILVLPNVGKSRLGLCFGWDFKSYYDVENLVQDLQEEEVRVVSLERFLNWVKTRPPLSSPQGQLLVLSPKAHQYLPESALTFIHEGVVVSIDREVAFNDSLLPGCFNDRLGQLLSDRFPPVFVHPTKELPKGQPIGEQMLTALSAEDVKRVAHTYPEGTTDPGPPVLPQLPLTDANTTVLQTQPDVLILDWEFRNPIFTPSPHISIQYSPALVHLVDLLVPSSPYLMVHWRMETVPPEALPTCAHSLIDTLSTLLRTPGISDDIKKVWFASDYPYPISLYSETSAEPQSAFVEDDRIDSAFIRKSGTFKDIGKKHEDAVGIFLMAFRPGGELDQWEVTDLSGEMVKLEAKKMNELDPEFLKDSGTLGILDKMIGMRASLFVSGAKGCGRKSSFTKQVIDARKQVDQQAQHGLRNTVDYFG